MKTKLGALLTTLALIVGLLSFLQLANAVIPRAVTGQAHVQDIGWMSPTDNVVGTTGRGLRLEAIKLTGWPIAYQVHVQNIGWMDWAWNGEQAGTTGKSLRIEAIRIHLGPGVDYDGSYIEYRCHIQDIGWVGWVKAYDVCGTTGQSRRLEAIQVRVITPDKPAPSTSPSVSPSSSVPPSNSPSKTFAVTADTGIEASGAAVLGSIGKSDASWVAHLGDMSYQSGAGIENRWCAYVKEQIKQPVQLLPGNHEAQNGDGKFTNYAACLPSRLSINGDYSRGQWATDDGNTVFIGISPKIMLPQGELTYNQGTAEREWLKDRIDEAKSAGRWVVVGMHVPCLTNGIHGCEGSASVTDLLIAKKVDVIVAGHDHNYGRTHQITGTTSSPTVVDRDSNFTSGSGSVFVIVGNGGHKPRELAKTGGIWAVGASGTQTGWLRISTTPSTLTLTEVGVAGGLTDNVTIKR